MTFIKLNGVTLHYKFIQHSTSGAVPTLLFINSLGTDFRIWDDVVDLMREHGNLLLFDKRGHGLSGYVETRNGLNDYADDAEALLNHFSIKKCIIIGLSVGGMIAQILASRIPQQIDKLVLCDTRHKIGNQQIWNERIAIVDKKGLTEISNGVMQRWFSEAFRKNEAIKVIGYKNMLERTPAPGYIKTCEAIRDADLTDIAKSIKTDTLCVAGAEDKSTTPDEVRSLADLIEGSKFRIIEGSGHIPCVDNPEILSNLIIDFIK
jgi:3-oxoadipate enol-lactonase